MTGPQLMDAGGEWMRNTILDLLRDRYAELRRAQGPIHARMEVRNLLREIESLPQIHGARSPHLPPEPPANETPKDTE